MNTQDFQLVFEDDLDDLPQDPNAANDPWAVATKAGIYITSDKDFAAGYACPEGVLVAAGFYSTTCGEFTFDVAVLPEDQGKGLGAALVDLLLNQGRELLREGAVDVIVADVVNPAMRNILRRRGFQEVDDADQPLRFLSPVVNRWRMRWFE